MLTLSNAAIYTPTHYLPQATVVVDRGRIKRISQGKSSKGESLEGYTIIPGFVDTHIHGYGGWDTNDATKDSLLAMAEGLVRHGITGFLPTTVTTSYQNLLACARATSKAIQAQSEGVGGARIIGLQLEGPFINPKKKGAQNPDYIQRPNWEALEAIHQAGNGCVRALTIAPELTGAFSVIEQATAAGWIVSLGHSNATYDEGMQAIVAGATRATHLFNAMAPLHHRQPGLVAACLESPQVFVELIADLVHVAPPLLRLTRQIVGAQRAVLITDSISATELPNGAHSLGGLTVTVENHVARLEDGTLAGSTLTMDRAVLNVTAIGVPFREALMMATAVPARSIGERIGTIQPGGVADFLVLNEDLSISRVYVAGHRMV